MGDFRENLLSTLSNDFIVNKNCTEQYGHFIDVIYEHQLFACKKSVFEVIRQMHEALNSSKSRLEALCLLQQLLVGCSQEVYEQHALVWAKLLLQILQSYSSEECQRSTCCILASLLSHAKCSAELGREFATSVLPPVITTLLESKCQTEALRCLCRCMVTFPGPCGPFKKKIENLVLPLMQQNKNPELVEASIRCFSLLPHCGGGGKLGVKHSEAWTEEMCRVLATLHKTLSLLYGDNESDSFDSSNEPPSLSLSRVSDIEPAHSFCLLARLDMLCRLLACLLTSGLDVSVQLPLQNILRFICRVLNLSPKMLMLKVTKEDLLLTSLLPRLHTIAFKLLTAVIKCAQSYMVRLSCTVNQLFVQTFGWSATDTKLGQVTLYSGLRTQLYSTVSSWLQVLGAASGIESISADLVSHIIQDCTPLTQVAKVQRVSRKPTESGGRKRRRPSNTTDTTATSSGHLQLDITGHEQVTQAALDALHQLMLTTGCFLTPKLHKSIQELVVPLLTQISTNNQQAFPAPYDATSCRLALYRALRDCVLCASAAWPAPTSCAVVTFSEGQRDDDMQVSTFCRESLLICETIIHPRAPSFNVPLLRDIIATSEEVIDVTRVTAAMSLEEQVEVSEGPPIEDDAAIPSTSAVEQPDTMQTTHSEVCCELVESEISETIDNDGADDDDDYGIGNSPGNTSDDNDKLNSDLPCTIAITAPFEDHRSTEAGTETKGETSEMTSADASQTEVEFKTTSDGISTEEQCSVSKKPKLSDPGSDQETHMSEDISTMLESFKDVEPDAV